MVNKTTGWQINPVVKGLIQWLSTVQNHRHFIAALRDIKLMPVKQILQNINSYKFPSGSFTYAYLIALSCEIWL